MILSKLTKLQALSEPSLLENNSSVEGLIFDKPIIGERLLFITDPVTKEVIRTSEIKSIAPVQNGCIFQTENSVYALIYENH